MRLASPLALVENLEVNRWRLSRLPSHSFPGAEVLSMANNDENKVFGITFRDAPLLQFPIPAKTPTQVGRTRDRLAYPQIDLWIVKWMLTGAQ